MKQSIKVTLVFVVLTSGTHRAPCILSRVGGTYKKGFGSDDWFY
jgi:hypothetical protein